MHTLRQVCARIERAHRARGVRNAADLARFLFNRKPDKDTSR